MENNAAAQLAAIADARSSVADRLITPWWYHPVLGLASAGFVLAYGLGNDAVRISSAFLLGLTSIGLMRVYKRLTGVWVSGLDAGRASRWAKAMGVITAATGLGAWAVGAYTELDWIVWVAAALVLVATVVLGRRFDVALRDQLRAGA